MIMEDSVLLMVNDCDELKRRIDEFLGMFISRFLAVAEETLHKVDDSSSSELVLDQPTASDTFGRETTAEFDSRSSEILSECDSIDAEFARLKSKVCIT
jgi:hypothetical protein